ncbi:TELO2-interacting protein 2-like [Frankliniella occidentalis]|uniref:TELO2-interacting protein 2-like n=1 Tax=Frankliniella occidentalis TaxID=133901 RepID=A0A6J1SMK7_FRAOC|nr:TELO2-interacting protein 2-like [Frankliniella occidentalis]
MTTDVLLSNISSDTNILNAFSFEEYISPSVWASFIKVVNASLLPEQTYGEDRPSEDNDFVCFREKVLHGLEALSNFMNKYATSTVPQSFSRDAMVGLLILYAEHSSPEIWTSNDSRNILASCSRVLCSIFGCTSPSELLLGQCQNTNGPCFKQALLLLRPKLLRNSWRKHPGAVASYKWLLFQVYAPNLSEYLDVVSPTALIILDDHDIERRLIGLDCVSHIIGNVTRTEMCQRGLHTVFYEALAPLLLQHHVQQIEPTVSCLIKLLSVTERGYTRSTEPGMWDQFDKTISTLIDRMVIEDQIPLRLAYIKSLGPLMTAMGPSVIRWSKPLLSVFDGYLSKESFDTREYALQALQSFLNLTALRINKNGDAILFLLLRALQDISTEINEKSVQPIIPELIKENIILIKKLAPAEFKSVQEELSQLSANSYMKNFLLGISAA